MSVKPLKVQAAAQLLATSVDTLRRMVDESGIKVARDESGPRTRLFSIENIFELARYRATRRSKDRNAEKTPVVATVYAPCEGVGATTLASTFASIFALKGLRVLVVDLDFQANLTHTFGYHSELTSEEALERGIPLAKVIEYNFANLTRNYSNERVALQQVVKKPFGDCGPHLVPADLTLDRLNTLPTSETIAGRNDESAVIELLKEGLARKDPYFDVSDYDVILFDVAAARTSITQGALFASDYIVSPVSMEKFSTRALSYLCGVIAEMQEHFDRSPELILVGNFFDPNRVRRISQLMTITQSYQDAWLDRSVRHSDDLTNAMPGEADLPLVLAKPGSQAAIDLRECVDALLDRVGLVGR